jgi:hypothetical protein
MNIDGKFQRSCMNDGAVFRSQPYAGASLRRLNGAAQQQRAGANDCCSLPDDWVSHH